MRAISVTAIAGFLVLLSLVLFLGVGTTYLLLWHLPLGDFRGVLLSAALVLITYAWAFLIYRLYLRFFPLQLGELEPGSKAEDRANINVLFYLVLFNLLIRTNFLPVPLTRIIYLALGAKLGRNTYSAGAILDPPLTRIGDNSIVGHGAVLFAHAIEQGRFALDPIQIGHDVTIGAGAIVMSGTTIGDGAVICAGAVLTKGEAVGAGEVWGGVPAKMIRSRLST